MFRQTTKNGLYNALDIGSIWLQKAKRDPLNGIKKGPSPAEETVLFVVLYSSVTSKSRGLPQPGHLGAPSSRSSSSNTVV